MKLSIIYNVSKYSDILNKSIKSLMNIKGNDFEIIFIFNINDKVVEEIIKKINFSNKDNISFVFLNQNLGHSYAYNAGNKLAIGDYVYFVDSSNIFKENFMEEFLKVVEKETFDLITLVDGNSIKFTKESYLKNKNTDTMSIKRKIINRKFIEDNNLSFTNYKNYNINYLFNLNEKVKKVGYIEKKTCDFEITNDSNHNLYDILTSSEELFKVILNSNFNQDKKDYFFMTITINILYEFILGMFKNFDDKNVIENSISNAYYLIQKIYPEFKENKYLVSNRDKKMPDYILNFKPTIRYCKKVLEVF